ncbi:hypothetical protein IKT18_03475 [Candidatus Saccharibacteria bacterium]|nr:hypothetical protein [Candidatus Saccharibacteria bacterium]
MKKSFSEGFTLVELALSMAFVGILSVSVVLIISDTVATYRRGLIIAQVNSAGMDIVDDMRLAVTNSSSRAVSADCARYYNKNEEIDARTRCEEDGAYSFVTLVKTSTITLEGSSEPLENVPIYGAFCTGTFSYIWNSGYYDMEEASFPEKTQKKWATLTYRGTSRVVRVVGSLARNADFSKIESGKYILGWDGEDAKPFRLLKIHDSNRVVCMSEARRTSSLSGGNHSYYSQEKIDEEDDGISGDFNIVSFGVMSDTPEDLIMTNADSDLALFDLYVARPAESTVQKNMFYSVSFILGTVRGGANIVESGKSCKAPTEYEKENFDYCAINKFNFAMQAGGE